MNTLRVNVIRTDFDQSPQMRELHTATSAGGWRFQMFSVDHPYLRPEEFEESARPEAELQTQMFDDEAKWAQHVEAKGKKKKEQDEVKAPIYEAYKRHAQNHDAALVARWTETLNILLTFVSRFWLTFSWQCFL